MGLCLDPRNRWRYSPNSRLSTKLRRSIVGDLECSVGKIGDHFTPLSPET